MLLLLTQTHINTCMCVHAHTHTHTHTLHSPCYIHSPDTLENTNAQLSATIETLEAERDDEIERVQELMLESTQLQFSKEKL